MTAMVREHTGLKLIREVLAAHSYWRTRGFMADLAILNQEAPGYDRPLNFQLQRIIDAHAREVGTDRPGGVFLRDWSLLSDTQRTLILSSSRAVLVGARGALARRVITRRPRAGAANAAFCAGIRRRRRTFASAAISGTQLFQRRGRLFAGWQRVCHLSGTRHRNTRALVERYRHSGFRLHGDREWLRLHVAGQQPAQQTHHMAERSGDRSGVRGHLLSR